MTGVQTCALPIFEGGPPREAYYDEYLKQAYVEADVDSILTIRRLIVEGRL